MQTKPDKVFMLKLKHLMPLPKSQTHSQMPKKWMGLSEVVEQRKPYWAQKLNKMFTINPNPEDAKKNHIG